jgi:hypothetical protein
MHACRMTAFGTDLKNTTGRFVGFQGGFFFFAKGGKKSPFIQIQSRKLLSQRRDGIGQSSMTEYFLGTTVMEHA